jgi:hypothetical protein
MSKSMISQLQPHCCHLHMSMHCGPMQVWKRSGLSENYTYLPPSVNPAICGTKPQTGEGASPGRHHTCLLWQVQECGVSFGGGRQYVRHACNGT